MLKKFLTQHLRSVDEGYFAHMFEAMYYGIILIVAGIICIIHSILPFIFTSYASRKIVYILRRIEKRYHKKLL